MQIKKIIEEGAELEAVRRLFTDYQKELNVDLCFQSFDKELEQPLTKYGPPKGAIFLAVEDDQPAGCIALKPLTEEIVCEMKRLYVPPGFRGRGIGEQLVTALLNEARELGYKTMKLDTITRLQSAIKMYKAYGFIEIPAYYNNPTEDVVYMEKAL